MELRLLQNSNKLIELVAFISVSPAEVKITDFHPKNYDNTRNLNQLVAFFAAFRDSVFDTEFPFTMTLTSQNGSFTFCHCLACQNIQTVTCILSTLPGHKHFFEFVSILNYLIIDNQLHDLENIVETALKSTKDQNILPDKYTSPNGMNICFKKSRVLPSKHLQMFFDEKGYVKELCRTITVDIFISIYEAMLFEKKILLTSSIMHTLTCCIYGILELIRPFEWQCRLIPIIYPDSYGTLKFPNPFIIGIPNSELAKLSPSDYPDAITIDLDNTRIMKNITWSDCRLPSKIKEYLKGNLKNFFNNNIDWSKFDEKSFIRIFSCTTVLLLEKYLTEFIQSENIKLKKTFFSMNEFKKETKIIESTQYFQNFISRNVKYREKQEKKYSSSIKEKSLDVSNRKGSLFKRKKDSLLDI